MPHNKMNFVRQNAYLANTVFYVGTYLVQKNTVLTHKKTGFDICLIRFWDENGTKN